MTEPRPQRPPEDMLVAAVEALVFAAGEPVPVREIAAALGGVPEAEIDQAVDSLIEEYQRRGAGFQVERVAGGLRLATRSDVGEWVRHFFRQRNRTRLSVAALETLAIVAYRQPITAPEIQAIRGVDSSASLKNLIEKKLLRVLGRKKVVGSPLLYGTSRHFLVHFGLDNLRDLPPIGEFTEMLGTLQGDAPISESVTATLEETQARPFEDTAGQEIEELEEDFTEEAPAGLAEDE